MLVKRPSLMAQGRRFFAASSAQWQLWAALAVLIGAFITLGYTIVENFWG